MSTNSNVKFNAKEIAIYGLFIALVYIATTINIQIGSTSGGLFHLGNVMSFTIAMVFGKKAGALSGGIGMALFDILSPYAVWAPFTLIIRLIMGYAIGYFALKASNSKKQSIINNSIGLIIAFIVMIVGYYVAEGLLYGNWIVPFQSVFANALQCIVGTLIAVPISTALRAGFKIRHIKTKI